MHSDDPQVESKKKKIKMEMIFKDSDFKKNVRTLVELDMLTRDLKKKKNMIEVELTRADDRIKKIQGEQITLQVEIKRLKNNLNLLQ